MTNHTPGPWTVNGNKIDGKGYHIASVNSHATTEGKANASLIAAAPDLLVALENALEAVLYMDEMEGCRWMVEQTISVIAKAKGKTK